MWLVAINKLLQIITRVCFLFDHLKQEVSTYYLFAARSNN